MKVGRWTTGLGVALVAALVAAVPVQPPHFGLRSSSPAADSSVPAPESLTLTFTQVPQDGSLAIRLIDSGEELVETGEPQYDEENRRIIRVSVEEAVAAGAYTVAWRGIGDDGHVVRGDFSFTVTAER